ncbi:iron export ABC transporter permease subunit FetB [Halalkalibacillus sediminis]|uniref:Iron export ABC transporter permease subunit FetB n=1 Tax=Halalkalibacillus sediminis TaxID=2018042 RepID=A0A2I0QXF1_9BACI|nr:iron export ABC transporter permease subunit FetB [Halalkalibacillus sediminis]PKR78989.1 iron export ABC transporter permease subunit FetB [Halalkalibacillus sediminis]
MERDVSNFSLLVLIVFVMIPFSIAYFYQLGLKKDILWSSIRGTVQLFLIGLLLTYLFNLPPHIGIPIMLTVMITVATFHARKKGKALPYVFPTILVGLIVIELAVLSLWLVFDMVSFVPEEVIPMSGMVIGNSMVAMGLSLERMKSEFETNRGQLLAALSLGATPRQASHLTVKKTLNAALIPNIDQLKTIGLVQLPGMMTGLILGGIEPIVAIKYQLVISISIFSSVSVSAIIVSLIMYRFFYNDQMQLVDLDELNKKG